MKESKYSWGIDGLGRAGISLRTDNKIIFHTLPGVSGLEGIYILEDQDEESKTPVS